jgi:hypothetical protein
MSKLKLGALVDQRPVKLTVDIPAATHRDLIAYAAAHTAEHGQSGQAPEKLVAPMLAMFMEGDKEFATVRRSGCPQ